MIEVNRLQALAQHLDFEFDPATCQISSPKPYGRFNTTAISEVDDLRYAEFSEEVYKKPSYQRDPVDGIVAEDLDEKYPSEFDDEVIEPKPDDGYDQSLNGLLEQRKGYIAFYWPSNRMVEKVYKFYTTNGPGGANKMHQALGRVPGVDIPAFEASDIDQKRGGVFTAGHITEAIADMKMFTTGVDDFYFTQHDLGVRDTGHGPSWPHTLPAVYRQLSRVAQETVEQYGERIHYTGGPEALNRPPVVVAIAKALDHLIDRLKPTIDDLAIMELRIRDGRYASISDTDIAAGLLKRAFEYSSHAQAHTAINLMVTSPEALQGERYRRGYWIGLQQIGGVVDTRLALHEVQPHPEASPAHTTRALNVLNIVKRELDRRFNENKDQLLSA